MATVGCIGAVVVVGIGSLRCRRSSVVHARKEERGGEKKRNGGKQMVDPLYAGCGSSGKLDRRWSGLVATGVNEARN